MKNVLDNDGDLSIVRSRKNAASGYWDYAKGFSYTAAGAVGSMQLGNGRWESTVFNSRLQPTQIALGTVQSGSDRLKLNFDYGTTNNNGNVLSQTITVPTETRNGQTYAAFTAVQTYAYDSLNRIKDAKEMIGEAQQWKQTFDYDRYGNRRFDANNTTTLAPGCQTAVCNPTIDPATNKLVGYSFDNAGNTKLDAENRQFIYDGENKQVEVKDQNGASIGKYYYNGDGQRVKKISATESTVFVYNASGQIVGEYATQIVQPQDAKVSYLTSDHLGSPRITTDANGHVISRRDFQPFGEEVARAGYGTDDVRQKFTGYERDTEAGLDFAEARYYNPRYGRFTAVDPLMASARKSDPQTFNRYSYVLNSPLRLVDPSGMISCPPELECQIIDGDEVVIDNGPPIRIHSPYVSATSVPGCGPGVFCGQPEPIGRSSGLGKGLGGLIGVIFAAGTGGGGSAGGILGGIMAGGAGGASAGGGGSGGSSGGGSGGGKYPPTRSGFTGKYDRFKNQAIADYLEENCDCSVRNNPNEGSGGNGDALVDGHNVEFKTLDPGTDSKTIKNQVGKSLTRQGGLGQGRDIVIDVRMSGMTENEARRGVYMAFGAARGKLDSITIIGRGFFFVVVK